MLEYIISAKFISAINEAYNSYNNLNRILTYLNNLQNKETDNDNDIEVQQLMFLYNILLLNNTKQKRIDTNISEFLIPVLEKNNVNENDLKKQHTDNILSILKSNNIDTESIITVDIITKTFYFKALSFSYLNDKNINTLMNISIKDGIEYFMLSFIKHKSIYDNVVPLSKIISQKYVKEILYDKYDVRYEGYNTPITSIFIGYDNTTFFTLFSDDIDKIYGGIKYNIKAENLDESYIMHNYFLYTDSDIIFAIYLNLKKAVFEKSDKSNKKITIFLLFNSTKELDDEVINSEDYNTYKVFDIKINKDNIEYLYIMYSNDNNHKNAEAEIEIHKNIFTTN